MNTLVLGGNGFIGSHLVDRLLAEGHNVCVYDSQKERHRKPLKQVNYFIHDFSNRAVLDSVLENINVVFHLISTTIPKTSNDDPIFDVSTNVIGTLYLLERCVKRNVNKIVFISSGGTIYGQPATLPAKEDSPANPSCSYGITKLTIEKYLELFYRLYDLDYVIIRPSNPYGPRQNFDGNQGIISVLLGKVARREKIKIWGNGEVVRDYIYISDIIDGIYKASTSFTMSRIYNMGSGEGISLNEIIRTARTVLKSEIGVEYLPGRSFDIPRIFLDCDRARRELFWEPSVEIHEGIKRTWSFIKEAI